MAFGLSIRIRHQPKRSRCSTTQQVPHPHKVVCRGRQLELLSQLPSANMTAPRETRDRLAPAEHLFNLLRRSLTDNVHLLSHPLLHMLPRRDQRTVLAMATTRVLYAADSARSHRRVRRHAALLDRDQPGPAVVAAIGSECRGMHRSRQQRINHLDRGGALGAPGRSILL